MERLSNFTRTTPLAFWLALLGVFFSLGVFVSGVFQEEGPFALIFMAPGFLTVAILSAIDRPRVRGIAAAIAGLMALVFAVLVVVFVSGPSTGPPGPPPPLGSIPPPTEARSPTDPILPWIHATGMLIAGAAAVSNFLAARSRPIGLQNRPQHHVFTPAIGLVLGIALGYVVSSAMQVGLLLGVLLGAVLGLLTGFAVDTIRSHRVRPASPRWGHGP